MLRQQLQAAKGGEVQFKAEKGGVVHAGVGKASFKEDQLVENVKAFVGTVAKAKPFWFKRCLHEGHNFKLYYRTRVTISIDKANAQ